MSLSSSSSRSASLIPPRPGAGIPRPASRPPGALDRFLNLFSEVRAGEGRQAILMALGIFLILTAYYVLKPVREALILGEGSAELKSYMSAGQAVLLLPVIHYYGRLADRVPRMRLINAVTAFFVICLVGFYALAQFHVPLGIAFFLWIGIFNVMIVAQFWSFANDLYTSGEGERLFPIIGFGMSLGAVLGAVIGPLGVYQLMLVGAGLLVAAAYIINDVDRRERARTEAHLPLAETTAELPAATGQYRLETGEFKAMTKEQAVATGSGEGAFSLVFRTRYLFLIALLILLTNWVNTTGEYILGATVRRAAAATVAAGTAGGLTVEQVIGKFYSDFFSVVNVLGVVLQLFAVSRIIKYWGVRVGLLFLPVIALVGYGLLAFYPVLAVVRWAKTAENGTDYSLQNTVKNALWLPTTREQKYKAKQVIDSFFVRAGDVLSAALVFVGTSYLALGASGFARVNLALVLAWLALAIAIGRLYVLYSRNEQPPA